MRSTGAGNGYTGWMIRGGGGGWLGRGRNGWAGECLKIISRHTIYMSITGSNPEKPLYIGPIYL